jgi:lysophospholipase L1-like esterase
MIKISVIADSLTLPRKEDNDVILYENTWPYLLERKINNNIGESIVINFGMRERTTDELTDYEIQEYVKFIEPDIVIMQVGVVDAMPRVISRKEKKILKSIFIPSHLRKFIIENRKKNRQEITLKDPLKKVYVRPDKFKDNILQFIKKIKDYNNDISVILIPILVDSFFFEEKSPGSESNLNIYNNILIEISKTTNQHFLDIPETDVNKSSFFCKDGYHLGILGNIKMADYLYNHLYTTKKFSANINQLNSYS